MAIDEGDSVTLSIEGPQPQRRWTVAVRIVLIIPHFLWLAVLSLVASIAVFFAWFGAVAIGRMPTRVGEFATKVVRYQTRVYAYGGLLTDVYPLFSPNDESYPADLDIVQPDRLNRWAVLFRFVLMLPAMFLASLVSGGTTIVLFFLWIITLVSGRMPDSAFEAICMSLRFQMRTSAYVWMLAARYPGGLFGDSPAPARIETPSFDGGAMLLPPPDAAAGGPRITRFVLSKAAKRLVVLFIVLGVLSNITSSGQAIGSFSRTTASKHLRSERAQLDTSLKAFYVDVQGCAAAADATCVRAANARLIAALRAFQRDVRAIDVPAAAENDKLVLDSDVTEMITILNQMQEAGDVVTYTNAARQLGEVGTRFDRDYEQLYRNALFG